MSARAATVPGPWHCQAQGLEGHRWGWHWCCSCSHELHSSQSSWHGWHCSSMGKSYTAAQWGLPEVSSTTSWNESPFLLQLPIFKQENESVLSQPSQFLYRNLADVWELLGELYCPSCGCCMHMGLSHGKPLNESCLLLVSQEVSLCSPVKILYSCQGSSLLRGLSWPVKPSQVWGCARLSCTS